MGVLLQNVHSSGDEQVEFIGNFLFIKQSIVRQTYHNKSIVPIVFRMRISLDKRLRLTRKISLISCEITVRFEDRREKLLSLIGS